MLYIFNISISYSGYIRTKSDLSGQVLFEEHFSIKTDNTDNLSNLIQDNETGFIKENLVSSFEGYSINDEIIRNDTYKTISVSLFYFDDEAKEFEFKRILSILSFPLKINLNLFFNEIKDLITVFNYKNLNFYRNLYFDFIDTILLNKNIRFNLPKYNLSKIKPSTFLYKKEQKLIYFNDYILLSFFELDFNSYEEVVLFLNKVLNEEFDFSLLEERVISNQPSKRQLLKKEKAFIKSKENQLETIIKNKKKDFILELKKSLKEKGFDENCFYLSIDLKI